MGSETMSGFHGDGTDNVSSDRRPSVRRRFANTAAGVLVNVVTDGLQGAAREIADQRRQYREIGLDVLDEEAACVMPRNVSSQTPDGLRGIARGAVEAVRVRAGRELVVFSLIYPKDVARAAGDSIKEGLEGRAQGALQQGQESARSSVKFALARRLGVR